MARKSVRLSDLAAEAETDHDVALVSLWDAGLNYVEAPSSLIRSRDLSVARSALELPDERAQMTVDYWLETSGLTFDELAERMETVGVSMHAGKRRIPKNSLRHFRRIYGLDEARQLESVQGARASEREKNEHVASLDWTPVGNPRPLRYLTEDDLVAIHEALEVDFRDSGDPIDPPGVKDQALVSMAAQRQHTSLGQVLKYPTAEMAGAALYRSVALNHGFHNGNKRTALVALIAFLDLNGLVMTCDETELFEMTLRVAQHSLVPAGVPDSDDRETLIVAEWVKAKSQVVDHQERPMKWIALKKKLREFGCEFNHTGKGNGLLVTRTVGRGRRLVRRKSETLSCHVSCPSDGADAQRNTIHKIRKALELDDEHDIDSQVFYHGGSYDSFIIQYRRILRRLGRL
jgi:death-on-curing family protein